MKKIFVFAAIMSVIMLAGCKQRSVKTEATEETVVEVVDSLSVDASAEDVAEVSETVAE